MWRFFKWVSGEEGRCKKCDAVVRRKDSSTGPLFIHLRSMHNIDLKNGGEKTSQVLKKSKPHSEHTERDSQAASRDVDMESEPEPQKSEAITCHRDDDVDNESHSKHDEQESPSPNEDVDNRSLLSKHDDRQESTTSSEEDDMRNEFHTERESVACDNKDDGDDDSLFCKIGRFFYNLQNYILRRMKISD